MTDNSDSRLSVLETEMKNERKNREDLEARLVTRIVKTETNIRNGVFAVVGLLVKSAFDWLKGGM